MKIVLNKIDKGSYNQCFNILKTNQSWKLLSVVTALMLDLDPLLILEI